MEAGLVVVHIAWTWVAGTVRLLEVPEVPSVDGVADAARGGTKKRRRPLDA